MQLSRIDVRNAKAFKRRDKRVIDSAVRASRLGITGLNTAIIRSVEDWLEERALLTLERVPDSTAGKGVFELAIAKFLHSRGALESA